MSGAQNRLAGSRSGKRIPKLRTRGRANRQKLLTEAQKLIEEQGARSIRFSDVFESAGVSRGSAYRIYDGTEDLMQDLAGAWINKFIDYIRDARPRIPPQSWQQLSKHLVAASASYWVDSADTLLILPRAHSDFPESYRAAVKDMTRVLAEIFETYFMMPAVPDWLSVLAMYTSLGDTIFAGAVRREGRISEQRLVEAQKICTTYLSFYLPDHLATRSDKT